MDNEAFLTEVPLKLFRVSLFSFGMKEKGQSCSPRSTGGGSRAEGARGRRKKVNKKMTRL